MIDDTPVPVRRAARLTEIEPCEAPTPRRERRLSDDQVTRLRAAIGLPDPPICAECGRPLNRGRHSRRYHRMVAA